MYESRRDTGPQLRRYLGVLARHRAPARAEARRPAAPRSTRCWPGSRGTAPAEGTREPRLTNNPSRGPAARHPMTIQLDELLERNRRWAAATEARSPGFFTPAAGAAGAAVPLDRLRRQPRAGQRADRPAAGRGVRAPQRRQRGRPRRPELPLGGPVRGRRAAGAAHHRRRPFALRRRHAPRSKGGASAWPTTGCATCRTCASKHAAWLADVDPERRVDALGELNVIEQARHVCETTVVRDAWARGQAADRARLVLRPAERPARRPRA